MVILYIENELSRVRDTTNISKLTHLLYPRPIPQQGPERQKNVTYIIQGSDNQAPHATDANNKYTKHTHKKKRKNNRHRRDMKLRRRKYIHGVSENNQPI